MRIVRALCCRRLRSVSLICDALYPSVDDCIGCALLCGLQVSYHSHLCAQIGRISSCLVCTGSNSDRPFSRHSTCFVHLYGQVTMTLAPLLSYVSLHAIHLLPYMRTRINVPAFGVHARFRPEYDSFHHQSTKRWHLYHQVWGLCIVFVTPIGRGVPRVTTRTDFKEPFECSVDLESKNQYTGGLKSCFSTSRHQNKRSS